MTDSAFTANEVAILGRVLEPGTPSWPREAAEAILALDFPPADKERMRHLLAKAKAGTLAPDEQAEIQSYERVGHLLNMLCLKARQSLKARAPKRGKTKPK
jgi:hypothetical protein